MHIGILFSGRAKILQETLKTQKVSNYFLGFNLPKEYELVAFMVF